MALPLIERCRGLDIAKFFRDYAAFASPKLLRLLEREGFRYAARDGAPLSRQMPCNGLPAVVASFGTFAIAPGRWNGRRPSGPGQ